MLIYFHYFGIFTTIKNLSFGFGGGLDINFNEFILILFLDPRIFFRTLQLLFFIFLIYFSIKKKIKEKKLIICQFHFDCFFFQYLSFNLNRNFQFDMYLFPLYIFIAAIILNKLKKNIYLFLSHVYQ